MQWGKDIELETKILYFTTAAWWQVTQLTTVNCLCQCTLGCKITQKQTQDSSSEEDSALGKDWTQLGEDKDVNFSPHVFINCKVDVLHF